MKREDTWRDDQTLDAPLRAPPSSSPATASEARYTDLGSIAHGGMGDVRRVQDHHLGRIVAMKVLRHDRSSDPGLRARFRAEVLRTASLQHPGIVSVYDWGERPDGRLWFTMPEIVGQTFRQLIDQLHQEAEPALLLLRRLITHFARVCEAVAYAHARGVVHRDLKPDNLMVGAFGEVLVMDLGLARRVRGDPSDHTSSEGEGGAWRNGTRHGQILGTPGYMPPEQARGEGDRLGPASDVYALGAVLCEILSGQPPHGCWGTAALRAVLAGPPPHLHTQPPPAIGAIPPELADLCARAMAWAPEDRHADAGVLAAEINTWLDGARRREQAMTLVEEALGADHSLLRLREEARALRAEAAQILASVAPHDPVARKLPAWTRQDEAARLDNAIVLLETRKVETLHSALRVLPDLDAARDALADCYRERVLAAEQRRDSDERLRNEALLQSYDRGRYRAFLQNEGRLRLHTEPPHARALLYGQVSQERRLQPTFLRDLGTTPIVDLALPGGSYAIRLEAEGCCPVDYPLLIERERCWDGIGPGGHGPPTVLPPLGSVLPDEVYVPAGWFLNGGDPEAPDSPPRRWVWVDGFCIARYPVTNAEYLAFLNALLARGEDVAALLPRQPAGSGGTTAAASPSIYPLGPDGRYRLPDTESGAGQIWKPDWPVVLVTWAAARAYCGWHAQHTGRATRLPDELEREKATRGVDGRLYPWGDFCDPTWAQMLGVAAGPPGLTHVGAHPADRSPYGMADGAGNVRDWCGNTWLREGPRLQEGRLILADHAPDEVPYRAVRGGAWSSLERLSRAAARFASPPDQRLGTLGFRIARSFPPPAALTPTR